ncbi:MAG TPA: amidohydrolase family protein [Pilimelia sp.]|nr:amidohydrolase family protein [Pilimelia sp.]
MIVDSHHHLWRLEDGYTWLDALELAPIRRTFTPDELVAELDKAGVDRTILVEGGRCDPDEAALLLAYAQDTPQIGGVVVWADLTDPGLADRLAGYRDLPGGDWIVGVRAQIQGEPDPDYLDRPDVHRGLRAVAAAGLAYDLVVTVDQLPAAARAAAVLPEVRFVLDHLGKPRIRAGADGLAQWRVPVAALAAAPNTSAKLSGLVTEADWGGWRVEDLRPYVTEAVELFGPDRLMFGSDWPVCLLAAGYDEVKSALEQALPPITEQEKRAIFGSTAARVYSVG